MYYIHQNFLVAAKFLHSRVVSKFKNNEWLNQIKAMLDKKLSSPIKSKQQAVQMVRVNLQNSENIIKNIIKANQKKQFFMVLNEYVQYMSMYPNSRIRDVLYNIE